MKAFKTFLVISVFINVCILGIYKHQLGLKTLTGMFVASLIAGLIIYNEARKINRSWDENERRTLIRKITELSVLTLMTCFSGALFIKLLIYTFI